MSVLMLSKGEHQALMAISMPPYATTPARDNDNSTLADTFDTSRNVVQMRLQGTKILKTK